MERTFLQRGKERYGDSKSSTFKGGRISGRGVGDL